MSRQKKTKKKKAVKAQKKKKREKIEKLWGLEFRAFNRGARQLVDQDYIDKLSPEEKKFLSDFNKSYYGNTFPKKSKPGPKTNMFDKAGIPRKTIFDQTNARNRDVHTVQYKIYDREKVSTENPEDMDKVDSIFDVIRQTDYNNIEDANIDYLDFKRRMLKYLENGFDEEEARSKALADMEL